MMSCNADPGMFERNQPNHDFVNARLLRPPVSVVIPTFNRGHTIERAIHSVLAQMKGDDEIIVVDDGSTDETPQILAGFGAPVRYITQPNSGPGSARNKGISAAANDLVGFLDSDDVWLPGKLDAQCALMAAWPDIVMSFSDLKLLLPEGRTVDSAITKWQRGKRPWEQSLRGPVMLSGLTDWPSGSADIRIFVGDLYKELIETCWIHCNTTMIRRSVAGDAVHFPENPDIVPYEDWGCFARVAKVGPIAFMEVAFAIQILHSGSRLTDGDRYARAASRINLLEEIWGRDRQFLESAGDRYREMLDQERLVIAMGAIEAGRTSDAHAQLRKVRAAPMKYRVLARLPGPIAQKAVSLRRAMQRMTSG